MEKVVAAVVMGAALIFIAPLVGTLVGAFTGWTVGLFFTETIFGFLTRLGFDAAGFSMWQIGAAMGFFGGFLRVRTHSTTTN